MQQWSEGGEGVESRGEKWWSWTWLHTFSVCVLSLGHVFWVGRAGRTWRTWIGLILMNDRRVFHFFLSNTLKWAQVWFAENNHAFSLSSLYVATSSRRRCASAWLLEKVYPEPASTVILLSARIENAALRPVPNRHSIIHFPGQGDDTYTVLWHWTLSWHAGASP